MTMGKKSNFNGASPEAVEKFSQKFGQVIADRNCQTVFTGRFFLAFGGGGKCKCFWLGEMEVRMRYNVGVMKNWNTDVEKLRQNKEKYNVWRLTQLINFGLDDEKLSLDEVERYWPQIMDEIDPRKKKILEYYLWQKQPF